MDRRAAYETIAAITSTRRGSPTEVELGPEPGDRVTVWTAQDPVEHDHIVDHAHGDDDRIVFSRNELVGRKA